MTEGVDSAMNPADEKALAVPPAVAKVATTSSPESRE